MAPTCGVNLVRYFFYIDSGITTKRKSQLVSLAYQTVQEQQLASQAILIRADSVNKITMKDPEGWYGIFDFKDETQLLAGTHVATYGHTTGNDDFQLKGTSHTPEKSDMAVKRNRKAVWPPENQLEEFTDGPMAYTFL